LAFRIYTYERNVFWNLNLERLYLKYNQIETLEGVIFPPNLKYLYLKYNQIETLEGAIFPPNLNVDI